MLENYTGSLDLQLSKDIHQLSESTAAISQSLAIIAGIMARKEGLTYNSPIKDPPTTDAPVIASNEPDIPTSEETKASFDMMFDRMTYAYMD